MKTVALIVAGGRGHRAGGGASVAPKQYRHLAGIPVLRRALQPFLDCPGVDGVLVVTHPDDREAYVAAVEGLQGLRPPEPGGATRQQSVLAGLRALRREAPDCVLVHDAARPFADGALISRVLAGLARADPEMAGVLPVLPVLDTVKRVDETGAVQETIARDRLRLAQTPQGFRFFALLNAHERAAREGRTGFTDDAALLEWTGLAVATVPGSPNNGKLTTADDFSKAEARLAQHYRTRVAFGFDVHAFGPGDHVMLGGIRIAHERALVGHSDADVALHALTDALLGTIADGDIGTHFPPSDARWRGQSSDLFLAETARRVRSRGGLVEHVDVTILCETPKIGPHRAAMVERIGEILGLVAGQVSVKATTTERLGFTGRGEGIAAQAVATVLLPTGADA
jgi:2-C-methyl-D-erythritol 4-phosphate cytidylyltransferase/2-C-methyl-D-erythritol 2,4-cyclodiphosphate synthase